MASQSPFRHDIVVIGGSGGSFDIVRMLLSKLPPDLPAALFIVIHGSSSRLPELFASACELEVVAAQSGELVKPGHVYVAVTDKHLLLHGGHILVRRGPRENMSRPAIDPLFRTAAASFGSRVIGVLLSGALNDGTAGLDAIKRMNGIAVVQDPGTALYPSMPNSAMRHVRVDHVVQADDLPALLETLVRKPAGVSPDIPLDIRLESAIAAQELADMETQDKLGVPSRFTCPECHGALWELDDGSLLRYRCHTGHAYTAEAVVAAQSAEIDELLGNLFRSHRERAALTHRMAEQNRSCERHALADQLETRAHQYDSDAELIRRLIQQANQTVAPMAEIDDRLNE